MNLSARDYAGRARGSVWELDLAQELRRQPEAARLDFLDDLITSNPIVGLDLARRCLSESRSFEVLLDRALRESNASSIRYWLECIVPRLGFRRVVGQLRGHIVEGREAVRFAKYWLPMFSELPGYSEAEVASLDP